jgi:hypothetical protein
VGLSVQDASGWAREKGETRTEWTTASGSSSLSYSGASPLVREDLRVPSVAAFAPARVLEGVVVDLGGIALGESIVDGR